MQEIENLVIELRNSNHNQECLFRQMTDVQARVERVEEYQASNVLNTGSSQAFIDTESFQAYSRTPKNQSQRGRARTNRT